jgi:hypothetical protein
MESRSGKREFGTFAWRVTATHVIAYAIAGLSVVYLLDYKELFSSGAIAALMRPVDSPIVALGPMLQVLEGIALSIILYPFRGVFLGRKNGWASLLLLIAGMTVFVPQIPGPGGFEGFLYTKLSVADHLIGFPEVFTYSLLFSLGLCFWHARPKRLWNILAVILLSLVAAMSLLGYLSAVGVIKA